MIIHTRVVLPALCVLAAGMASAQTATPIGDPDAGKARIEYRSAFTGYQAYRDASVADWRAANATVRALDGHAGHAAAPPGKRDVAPRESQPAAPAGGQRSLGHPHPPGHAGGQP